MHIVFYSSVAKGKNTFCYFQFFNLEENIKIVKYKKY